MATPDTPSGSNANAQFLETFFQKVSDPNVSYAGDRTGQALTESIDTTIGVDAGYQTKSHVQNQIIYAHSKTMQDFAKSQLEKLDAGKLGLQGDDARYARWVYTGMLQSNPNSYTIEGQSTTQGGLSFAQSLDQADAHWGSTSSTQKQAFLNKALAQQLGGVVQTNLTAHHQLSGDQAAPLTDIAMYTFVNMGYGNSAGDSLSFAQKTVAGTAGNDTAERARENIQNQFIYAHNSTMQDFAKSQLEKLNSGTLGLQGDDARYARHVLTGMLARNESSYVIETDANGTQYTTQGGLSFAESVEQANQHWRNPTTFHEKTAFMAAMAKAVRDPQQIAFMATAQDDSHVLLAVNGHIPKSDVTPVPTGNQTDFAAAQRRHQQQAATFAKNFTGDDKATIATAIDAVHSTTVELQASAKYQAWAADQNKNGHHLASTTIDGKEVFGDGIAGQGTLLVAQDELKNNHSLTAAQKTAYTQLLKLAGADENTNLGAQHGHQAMQSLAAFGYSRIDAAGRTQNATLVAGVIKQHAVHTEPGAQQGDTYLASATQRAQQQVIQNTADHLAAASTTAIFGQNFHTTSSTHPAAQDQLAALDAALHAKPGDAAFLAGYKAKGGGYRQALGGMRPMDATFDVGLNLPSHTPGTPAAHGTVDVSIGNGHQFQLRMDMPPSLTSGLQNGAILEAKNTTPKLFAPKQ